MEAAANKVVSIIYELRRNNHDGEIVETLSLDNPMTFLLGSGNLLPKFEEKLIGLNTGQSFKFILSSEEAYGPVQENAIVDVPITIFEADGKTDTNLLQVGNVIPMMDREGRRLNGVVKTIDTETVTMDFNHPLAGSALHFSGEINPADVRVDAEMVVAVQKMQKSDVDVVTGVAARINPKHLKKAAVVAHMNMNTTIITNPPSLRLHLRCPRAAEALAEAQASMQEHGGREEGLK
jgi:FKBP-type peptidyl-prolyl cis-trans isomerase SlyD